MARHVQGHLSDMTLHCCTAQPLLPGHGEARRGRAQHDEAGHGEAGHSEAGRRSAFARSPAQRGLAGRRLARLGSGHDTGHGSYDGVCRAVVDEGW